MNKIFDKKKGIEVIHYFINRGVNSYFRLNLAMFYADAYHLSENGFFITNDRYMLRHHRPTPIGFGELLRSISLLEKTYEVEFSQGLFIRSAPANLDYFSKSNIEALEFGVKYNKEIIEDYFMPCSKTKEGEEIKLRDVAEIFANSSLILDYMDLAPNS